MLVAPTLTTSPDIGTLIPTPLCCPGFAIIINIFANTILPLSLTRKQRLEIPQVSHLWLCVIEASNGWHHRARGVIGLPYETHSARSGAVLCFCINHSQSSRSFRSIESAMQLSEGYR